MKEEMPRSLSLVLPSGPSHVESWLGSHSVGTGLLLPCTGRLPAVGPLGTHPCPQPHPSGALFQAVLRFPHLHTAARRPLCLGLAGGTSSWRPSVEAAAPVSAPLS